MADIPKYNVYTGGVTRSTFLPSLRSIGLNQQQLARAFGTTPGAISHWFTGARTPPSMALRLAQYVLSDPRVIGCGLPTIGGSAVGLRAKPERKVGRPRKAK
jgi:transcriptional regulator with XRE-family HTH domain